MNNKISAKNINLFYGEKQALFDINLDFKERTVTALMEWVNSHTSSTNHRGSKRVNKNNQTKKYKRGINRKTRNRGRRTTYGRR